MNGTIKKCMSDKGFGFIKTAQGDEYFFHRSAVTSGRFDDLREGASVSFEEEHSSKGPRAANVRVI